MVLVVWLGGKPTETPSPIMAATNVVPQPSTARAIAATSQPKSAAIPTTAPAARVAPGAPTSTPPSRTKAEQMKEGLGELNDEDIVFYGKVLDQFGSPVGNAKVAGSVQVNNGTREGVDKCSLVTDGNGLFTISGYKGKTLGIWITKNGYVMATTKTSFVYSHLWPEAEQHNPDPNNPVVIKMRKLQGAEPLVGIGKEYRLPFTGAPLFFDLLTGKVSDSGGDLQVVITRAPGSISKQNPGDWSIEFKPVSGGIMESDDATYRVSYEAPADGYQNSDLVQMNHDNPAWFDNIQRVFFLTSRNGQVYSKFYMDFGINGDPNGTIWFQFKGTANANGSRNWEGDSSTVAMTPQ